MYACHARQSKKIAIYNAIKKNKNFLLENLTDKDVINMFFCEIIEELRNNKDNRIFDVLKGEKEEKIMTTIFYGDIPDIDRNDKDLRLIRIFLEFHDLKIQSILDFDGILNECVEFLREEFNFSIFKILFELSKFKDVETDVDYYFKIFEKTIFLFREDYVGNIPYDDIFKVVDILKSISFIINNRSVFYLQHNSIIVNEPIDFAKNPEMEQIEIRKNLLTQLNTFIDVIFPKKVLEADAFAFDEQFIIKYFCRITCNDLLIRVLEQRFIHDLYFFASSQKLLTEVARKIKRCQKTEFRIKFAKKWKEGMGFKIIPRWCNKFL